MNSEAQRQAIAEACGYTRGRCPCGDELCSAWQNPAKDNWEDIPDYLHSLDAMHVAEALLTNEQRAKFVLELHFATEGDLTASLEIPFDRTHYIFPVLHATAAERAKAFLRTIGKWEDGK